MSTDEMRQLHGQYRTSEDRYTYFLLAAAAASIGFAVQLTSSSQLSILHAPLGLAVLAWGFSFFAGCKHIAYVNTNLYANFDYLHIFTGTHPKVGNHPEMIQAATEGIASAMEKNSTSAVRFARWQFRALITGAILFLVWHVAGMVARTGASI